MKLLYRRYGFVSCIFTVALGCGGGGDIPSPTGSVDAGDVVQVQDVLDGGATDSKTFPEVDLQTRLEDVGESDGISSDVLSPADVDGMSDVNDTIAVDDWTSSDGVGDVAPVDVEQDSVDAGDIGGGEEGDVLVADDGAEPDDIGGADGAGDGVLEDAAELDPDVVEDGLVTGVDAGDPGPGRTGTRHTFYYFQIT